MLNYAVCLLNICHRLHPSHNITSAASVSDQGIFLTTLQFQRSFASPRCGGDVSYICPFRDPLISLDLQTTYIMRNLSLIL